MEVLSVCPGSLSEGFNTYSPQVLRHMFDGKKVSHILEIVLPAAVNKASNTPCRMSISGYQLKYSLVLDKNSLRMTDFNESGKYILKPVTFMPKNEGYAPANEHLTMQIAKQVFNIETADNAMIFLKDGTPALLIKRFDYDLNSNKLFVEDFAAVCGKTPAIHGEHYKYTGNYLEVLVALKQSVASWRIEILKLFRLILFNYLFSNGDAHLKNFSLIETGQGDYKLSPAYDLLNTRLHINDKDFALEDGLLPKAIAKGKIREQLRVLAHEAGIGVELTNAILQEFISKTPEVTTLIDRSFLSARLKRNYLQAYLTKIKKLS